MPARRTRIFAALIAPALITGCASKPIAPPEPQATSSPPPAQAGPAAEELTLREVFPHVRVDTRAKVVEFDAQVVLNAHEEATPRVFLEVTACTPDSRAHETLVVTSARPSHVHAALLLLGLTPGTPGSWTWNGSVMTAHEPKGPNLEVTIISGGVSHDPAAWIIDVKTGKTLRESALPAKGGFVFAGSLFQQAAGGGERYAADNAGTIIGLTTFGDEVVALAKVYSPESRVQEPTWAMNPALVPAMGTAVVVRLRVID